MKKSKIRRKPLSRDSMFTTQTTAVQRGLRRAPYNPIFWKRFKSPQVKFQNFHDGGGGGI